MMQLNIKKDNWKKVKLIDVVIKREENDRQNAKNQFDRFLKVEHMDAESLHIKRWASQQNGDELNPSFYKIFRKGQILYPTRNPHLRRAVIASFDGICGEKTLTLEPIQNFLVSEFVPFLFHSESFYTHTTSAIIGSTNPHVRWRDVANYEFTLPPKDQQHHLAELLWSIDNVVEKNINLLAKLKLTYLSKIENELFAKDATRVKLSDLGMVIRGVNFKPDNLVQDYSNQACVILRSNNIYDSKINFDDVIYLPLKMVNDDQILKPGDFAICMSNGSKELVGKAAKIITEKINISIGSFCAGFRASTEYNKQLIEHLFASSSYKQSLKKILTGTAINNLKPSDIEGIHFRVNQHVVPTLLDELKKIKNTINDLEEHIQASKNLHKTLVNQIF